MANKSDAEADTISVQETKENTEQAQNEECEDIGKCADTEDKRKMTKKSLSEQTLKQRLSSKSLFNLFSRKKVSSVRKLF